MLWFSTNKKTNKKLDKSYLIFNHAYQIKIELLCSDVEL